MTANNKNGIKIDLGKYVITSDDHNFILSDKIICGDNTKTPGQERLRNHKYYVCLKHLCTDVLRLELRRSDAKSIKELIAALTKLSPLIQAISEGKDYDL